MQNKKNLGTFKNDTYLKKVSFSKAVLWRDRQISLPPEIVSQFLPRGIKTIVFEDRKKGERWQASVDVLRKSNEIKKVGQERQYYFPIESFIKSKIDLSTP